ncbi:MAG: GNAT family N-acetyltransferase [Phaeovulum sp.]|uniref:GNAT family N-acetyltransferase n=1 Tax=Phaeovulum sp. TaxID=2934796 RepID=UPI002731A6DD|nr:GNAT family N-acetyltransferase [Phaeovulum sp.]MDP2062343.1 GNAT family N-acetyltransferase [Phaeovulum sp.]MDP3860079.1 GNAT family N-acetyltransferase [Phaeovulum sp.]
MTMIEIRDAQAGDEAAWRDLWAAYLAFYGVEIADEITDATWARALDADSRLGLRLALAGGQVLGFAAHHWHLSTWTLGPDGYLEDLYVAEAARGQGIGRALIEDLMVLGRARGWARLYWMTERANETARRLYDSIATDDGHIRYRMVLQREPAARG